MEPRVVGLDLSWTGTGMVDNKGRVELVKTSPKQFGSDRERLEHITTRVVDFVRPHFPSLVLVESPSFGSTTRAIAMGGLWWYVTQKLWLNGYPLVDVSPSTRAMWATGKGNASKTDVVLAVGRREPDLTIASDDIADAAALRALGAHVLDIPIRGWDKPTKEQLRAVDGLVKTLSSPVPVAPTGSTRRQH